MSFAAAIQRFVAAGDRDRARALCRERLKHASLDGDALVGLAMIDLLEGHSDRAIRSLRKAIRASPHRPDLPGSLGTACLLARRFRAAVRHFTRARALVGEQQFRAELRVAYLGSASEAYRSGRIGAAIRALENLVRVFPEDADAWSDLGVLHGRIGNNRRSGHCLERAVALQPDRLLFRSSLAVQYLYRTGISPEAVRDAHTILFSHLQTPAGSHANTPVFAKPIRMGYYSADFGFRAGGPFLLALLRHHCHSEFVIICFSNTLHPDEYTATMKSLSDKWHETASMTDSELRHLIVSEQIDILIDTTGHFDGARPCLFASQPAPIQMHMIGYPATMGTPGIQYRLTDALADPPGATEHLHTEELLRLSEIFCCYTPPPGAPAVAARPTRRGPGITLGCFQRREKINRDMLIVWAKILRSLPEARLLIHCAFGRPGSAPAVLRNPVEKVFAANGVAPERLVWSGPGTYEEYLGTISSVDVVLDTFPYNGTTTTCEALYMGVPVITLAGSSHISCVGLSLLTNMGLADWIAHSPDDYVAIALRAAESPGVLQELRETLRARLCACSITDGSRYTAAFETELKRIWRQWCDSQSKPF